LTFRLAELFGGGVVATAGFGAVLTASFGVFAVITLGGVLRRTGVLKPELDPTINRLILTVFYPAFIFSKILGNPALDDRANLIQAPLMGMLTIGIGYVFCRAAARALGLGTPSNGGIAGEAGTFAVTAGMFNYGYIAFPLAETLFGDATVGALFLHNVGVEIMMWTVGLFLLSGTFGKQSLRNLINMPMFAIALGIGLTLIGLDRFVPPFLARGIEMLGDCCIPVALLFIGAFVADKINRELFTQQLKIPASACLLRLGLLPLIMLGLVWLLPLTDEVTRVVLIQAAMPTAVFPVVLARQYGGDVKTAVRCVLATALLSAVTIPLWIRFGMRVFLSD